LQWSWAQSNRDSCMPHPLVLSAPSSYSRGAALPGGMHTQTDPNTHTVFFTIWAFWVSRFQHVKYCCI
jgi:hypothetical protein